MLPVSDFKIQNRDSFNLLGRVKVKVVLVACMTVLGLFFAQLVFANNLATDGERLTQIRDEIRKLELENNTLKIQIVQSASLDFLSQKAPTLGFSKPSKIITP